ncbi:hypothetical protein L2Y96_02605 [Luteibacter aegosomaticola]|uniref:hypothetical protein n=1 Tax=Luteibacter aegosomaticola TaxID=2911538 RepID=UPI001FFA1711|nr:hypothetical protein [Luteibacter aegosomaticola]UPG90683.1 hypothetical protein L2Y96_02605 [Luteibacter aegosomaticola]
MNEHHVDYHIATVDSGWGIFRDGTQIGMREDAADAIAFANFFADRETLIAPVPVRVTADIALQRAMAEWRLAA